jgi:two-component system OmpR family response regulator
MRALVIEDDQQISGIVSRALETLRFDVNSTPSGNTGLSLASTNVYDIIILDLMLPERDGLSIISDLRKNEISTPVLILSAKRDVGDRIEALRAGGDDYLVKPFATDEMLARVEALVRRSTKSADDRQQISSGGLTLDLIKREVEREGKKIELQAKEFTLLELLMRNAGRTITKAQILSQVWKYEFDPQTNVVDVLVFRLRTKIDKDFDSKLIHTLRGSGYVFKPE